MLSKVTELIDGTLQILCNLSSSLQSKMLFELVS